MRLRKFDRLSRSKSSNVPIRSADLWSCPNAGSSSAPLRGSIAAAAWLKTGSASTERPWHSYASHQLASCSENFAIRPEVSGQTLRSRTPIQWRGPGYTRRWVRNLSRRRSHASGQPISASQFQAGNRGGVLSRLRTQARNDRVYLQRRHLLALHPQL